MLANGRDVRANGAEGISAVGGTESARDFLLDFNHAHVALGKIIIKRDAEIVHESQDALAMKLESIK